VVRKFQTLENPVGKVPMFGKNRFVRREALCRNTVAGKSGLASPAIRVNSGFLRAKKGFSNDLQN
jgi:hypothetical protein